MKIILKNVGVFKYVEYELGDLTIICGENNSGKTYATYCLYGFYDFWNNGYLIKRTDSEITKLMETGSLKISLKDLKVDVNEILLDSSKQYTKYLPNILAANEKHFENSSFEIRLDENEINVQDEYNRSWRTQKREMIQISKEMGKDEITVSLLIDTQDINSISIRQNLKNAIGQSLKDVIFGNTFSDIFIASAERTGAVIFKDELNFEKNIILKELAGSNDINMENIINKVYSSRYALPVKRNIDFIRKLEDVSKRESFITKMHPDILDDFIDIIGGEYKVGKDGLYYTPRSNKNIKLSMGESSSSVRSLLDVGFYLRHIAEKGDILMIDEPELNLHPCNQRRLAKLLARLINIGIKVFITTHSDYIVKEMNTLIMLHYTKESESIKNLMFEFKYKNIELIDPDRVKVYISEKGKIQIEGNTRKSTIQSLFKANIDKFYGIEASSFDNTIDVMNKIQQSIIIGR